MKFFNPYKFRIRKNRYTLKFQPTLTTTKLKETLDGQWIQQNPNAFFNAKVFRPLLGFRFIWHGFTKFRNNEFFRWAGR